MIGWIILATYLIGFLVSWRRFAWWFATDLMAFDKPDGEDVFMGIFMGGLAAFVWPIAVPGWALWRIRTGGSPLLARFLKEPEQHRRERELNEREQRIAQLEQELGINPPQHR